MNDLPALPQDPPLISGIETLDEQLSSLDQRIEAERGQQIRLKLEIEGSKMTERLLLSERRRVRARKRIAALAAFKLKQVDEV